MSFRFEKRFRDEFKSLVKIEVSYKPVVKAWLSLVKLSKFNLVRLSLVKLSKFNLVRLCLMEFNLVWLA